jgi:cold shock protein
MSNGEMRLGNVKSFDRDRGFGFLSPAEGGRDIFLHISAVRASGLTGDDLQEGDRVEFIMGKDRLGRDCAERIVLLNG